MAQFNPLFLDTGSIEVIPSSRNSVVDFIHFPTTQSGYIFSTLLPDPYLVASQSTAVSDAVNTTSSSLYQYDIPNRLQNYFYTTNAIIGVSTTVTTTGARIGLQRSQNANTAFNIKSPSTLTAFTFACVGTEDNTIFVLPAGHAAINTIYPTHVRGLTTNAFISPSSSVSNTFLLQSETNNSVTAATGSVFYNQYAGNYISEVDTSFNASASFSNLKRVDALSPGGVSNYQIAIQSDGKIITPCTLRSAPDTDTVARFNTNGTLDGTFTVPTLTAGAGSAEVYSVDLQSDGKIIIGGFFTTVNGTPSGCIARLNTNGTLDTTFNVGTALTGSGGSPRLYTIRVLSDGKIMIGGSFTTYSGSTANYIARINSNGTLDTTFNSGVGFNGSVQDIAVLSDNKILAAGGFTTYSGSASRCIIRINEDGTKDNSFNVGTGTNTNVNSIAVQDDGKIILGGFFTTYSGSSNNRIVRLNTDGTKDTSFTIGSGFAGIDGVVKSVVVLPNKQILAGGSFNTYNGVSSSFFTRLNPNGKLEGTLTPDGVRLGIGEFDITGSIYGMRGLSNNQAYVVGVFGGLFNKLTGSVPNSPVASPFLRLNPVSYSNNTPSPLYLLTGSLKAISGSDTVTSTFLPATSSLWISESLTANVSNTSNTVYATVFDTAGLVTGQRYLANLYIAARTAATTTGFRMRVQNGTEYRGSIWIPTSATAVSIQNSANGTNITNAVPTAAPAGTFLVYAEYTFVKGATNPQVQILSEINGSAVTAGTGSVIFYRPITH